MLWLLYTGCGLCYEEEYEEQIWEVEEEQREEEETIQARSKYSNKGLGSRTTTETSVSTMQTIKEEDWFQADRDDIEESDRIETTASARILVLEEKNKALQKSLRAAQKELVSQDGRIIHLDTELQIKKAQLDDATSRMKQLQVTLDKAIEALEEAVTKKNETCCSELWSCLVD